MDKTASSTRIRGEFSELVTFRKKVSTEISKLGWMVLAHNNGVYNEVANYINDVRRLHKNLIHKASGKKTLIKLCPEVLFTNVVFLS
jgi:hypothetical protein